ncbi:hypothetical protein K449DRAFT_428234 [Hypoxylon sp. EC38]|nr:hypothetical protein K449DRAFT_428234 [Hypoxylon sp. EC38]
MAFQYTPSFLANLSPQDREEAEQAQLADQISTYFTPNPRLKYAGVAGMGTHGGALLFREFNEAGDSSRRIIVKYSLTEEADNDLRNENECLQHLRGAEHIAQLIYLKETELNVTGTGKRPTIALEYMEHGDGHTFRDKLVLAGITVTPSRILWSIFFCLIRQTVAMAYPPQGGHNAPIRPDRIPTGGGVEDFGLTQGSPHPGNIVFGDLSARGEHNAVPIVKLIDFGRGAIQENKDHAHFMRILGAAQMLICCALPTMHFDDLRIRADGTVNGYVTQWGLKLQTYAHEVFLGTENMDVLLRDIVAVCLSPTYFPELQYLLKVCLGGIRRRLEHFDNPNFSDADRERESDEAIKKFIQETLLDGDVKDIPQDFSRPTVNLQMGTTLLGLFASQNKSWAVYNEKGKHQPIGDVFPTEDDVD